MADIFISYARADRGKIEKLASALEGEGYSVWWDRQIVGGSEFSAEIEKELTAAKAVIVAWSSDAIKSRWVKDEAVAAADAGKLIPTSIDGSEAPMGFRQFHVIDLTSWKGDTESLAFKDLSRAVTSAITGEISVAATPSAPKGLFGRMRASMKDDDKNSVAKTAIIATMVVAIVISQQFGEKRRSSPPDPAEVAASSTAETTIDQAIEVATPNNVDDTITATPLAASIAVLPFADLSPDGDQEYFSDGISEEILNVLADVEGLKVASRRSSFQYKGQAAIGIPVIADALQVRHLLEGSVRKAGDTVRITAQLIDAQSDQQLWSETYDRVLSVENLFAVQDEIATEIVNVLGGQLTDGASLVDVVADTGNLDAYELYLEAQNRFIERGTPEFFRDTISMFERVTELDPDFARGWAGLAGAASIAGARLVTDRDYDQIARSAANGAIALNPKMSLPYAALARLEERQSPPNHEAAQQYYQTAIKNDPREPTTLHWLAYSLIQLGYNERSIEYSEKCLALDPNYQNCRGNIAAAYFRLGELEKAIALKHETLLAGTTYADADYLYYLAQTGNDAGVISYVMSTLRTFGGEYWMIEPTFRAIMDPDYDRAEGLRRIKTRLAASGPPMKPEDALYEFLHFTHGAYADLQPFKGAVIWGVLNPDYVASPERKRIFRDAGLPNYWRKHGFPPQCRPMGADDFECD